MQITKKLRKAKGFTLVELLIVIIIIGILAGMMMLATGAATDKAEATKILSNMRNIKAGAVMLYADTNHWANNASDDASIGKYLDNGVMPKGYTVTTTSDDTRITLTYANAEPPVPGGVAAKLIAMTDVLSADTSKAVMIVKK